MFVESTRIRDLLNTTVEGAAQGRDDLGGAEETAGDPPEPPPQYEFSVNPIPALVILLLGLMMSSHAQTSRVGTMLHKQWGQLLTAAAFSRGLSYVLMYLRPPASVLPSRPPTELLAAFGLLSGGLLFMASVSAVPAEGRDEKCADEGGDGTRAATRSPA